MQLSRRPLCASLYVGYCLYSAVTGVFALAALLITGGTAQARNGVFGLYAQDFDGSAVVWVVALVAPFLAWSGDRVRGGSPIARPLAVAVTALQSTGLWVLFELHSAVLAKMLPWFAAVALLCAPPMRHFFSPRREFVPTSIYAPDRKDLRPRLGAAALFVVFGLLLHLAFALLLRCGFTQAPADLVWWIPLFKFSLAASMACLFFVTASTVTPKRYQFHDSGLCLFWCGILLASQFFSGPLAQIEIRRKELDVQGLRFLFFDTNPLLLSFCGLACVGMVALGYYWWSQGMKEQLRS